MTEEFMIDVAGHSAAEQDGADQSDSDQTSAEQTGATSRLWDRDTGTLREPSRRVLVALLRGPYVSAEKQPQNWRALMADAEPIRSRLADTFLDLVIDDERGVAFVRNAETYDGEAPQVVRTASLTLMDTAMLLHLRRELVSGSGTGRVIVGREEIYEHLQAYRSHVSTDDAGFTKRINSAWSKMEKLGILLRTTTSVTDGRFEISPVLRLIFGAEQIEAVRAEYAALRGAEPAQQSLDDDTEPADTEPGETEEPADTDTAETGTEEGGREDA